MTLTQVSSSDPHKGSGQESHVARMGPGVPATPPDECPITAPPGLSCQYQTHFIKTPTLWSPRQVSTCGTCVALPRQSTVQPWHSSVLTAEGSHTPQMPHTSPLAIADVNVTALDFHSISSQASLSPLSHTGSLGHCPTCRLLCLRGLRGPAH